LARGITEEGEVDEEWVPREERRSPAAVFGSKRIGLEVIPRRLEENIQLEITSMSPYLLSPTLYFPLVEKMRLMNRTSSKRNSRSVLIHTY
jgi:hypothetical protein